MNRKSDDALDRTDSASIPPVYQDVLCAIARKETPTEGELEASFAGRFEETDLTPADALRALRTDGLIRQHETDHATEYYMSEPGRRLLQTIVLEPD